MNIGFNVNRSDGMVLVVFGLAAIGFSIAAYKENAEKSLTLQLASEGRYNATPTDVIGEIAHSRGALDGKFTLVEFGDYQCAPCRAENPKVASLVNLDKPELRFVFRNLPLTSIHPLAMQAALVAEETKSASQFWCVHDLLYTGPRLDQSTIQRAQSALEYTGADSALEASAKDVVKNDMNEAASLGIQGTPTFVLCCPNGIVRRITSLDQVESLVERGKK